MFAVFEKTEWEGSGLVGLFTDEGSAIEAGREFATRRWREERWWRTTGCIVVVRVPVGVMLEEGGCLSWGNATVCKPYHGPRVADLNLDDRPIIEGSTGWRTEASYGADDGTGRGCAYSSNQYRRSVRRAARQVLRAYCR
jgi:hypothetical protein